MIDMYAEIKNYEFKKTLGEGNFAKVKLSIFKPTNEEFAIKIINKNKLKQKMKNTTFRETEIISYLKHPNIITVYQMLEDEENFYIIMENCKRGELFDYIVEHQNLSENEAAMFFYQLINGVEYIHSQNIVHRDLKPENLLLTENYIIKIIDFGLSHPFDGSVLLKTKCGSPSYAAPEIITCKEYDGFKTDVWCCGVILYAMLCGFLPFEGENDTELFKNIVECDPEIPRQLSKESKQLIRKIFTPNPLKRITIPEIKTTDFYLKGKALYINKFGKSIDDVHPEKNIDLIKDLCQNLFEVENDNNKIINTDNNNNNIDKIITIDEENDNNYEAITIASNDEDLLDDDKSNIKKRNNINIYDLHKIKVAQTINTNSDENREREMYNKMDELEDKNTIHLQAFGNADRTLFPKMKLQLNFNNNLRNYYNNNNIFNSFRKKLINEELNIKLKKKFENYQKILKTEGNELKNENNKIQSYNQRQEILNPININHINNINNTNNINNINKINNNPSNKKIEMPKIKDNTISTIQNSKKNMILKIIDSNSNKKILNSNRKSKRLILGRTPNRYKNVLNNNINIKANESTSFKRFCDNLLNNNKISINSLSSKRQIYNTSNNNKNRTHFDDNVLNTINITKTYLNNKAINSKSIEVKNINHSKSPQNNSLITKKSSHYISPWKNIGPNITKKGRISPSINSLKNTLMKNNVINTTPEHNLYYNNINININTINVNENRNHKKIDNKLDKIFSEKRRERKDESNNYMKINLNNNSEQRSLTHKKNSSKINFTKIIAEAKNKNTIYNLINKNNFEKAGNSLGPHHKKKEDLYLLKTGNMQRNLGYNNLSKNYIIKNGNPRSEDKNKRRETINFIPKLNNHHYFKIHNLKTKRK